MKTLGLRHVALNVKDPQASKAFYCELFSMDVEWEPDPDNVYLSSAGQDNLALHKGEGGKGALDHIGFFVATLDEVDQLYEKAKSMGAPIAKEIKTHRDGARSFYLRDPDGIVIQVLYHLPIVGTQK